MTASLLRASLVQELGLLGDEEVIQMCRQNFENLLKDRTSVPADLRPPAFAIAMRNGDAATWQKLHELGLKTTSTEEKQNYYDALAFTTDPKLIQKSLAIALTDEIASDEILFRADFRKRLIDQIQSSSRAESRDPAMKPLR